MRRSVAAALVGLLAAVAAPAQTRWTVDPKASLVWWQVSPHLNHLWATTCPEERSWRPGENRSSGWNIDPKLKMPHTGYGNVDDTVRVPLFPRPRVSSVCGEAVKGRIVLPDTVGWRGARGEVVVRSDALITGEAMRDVVMHQVLQTWQFPEIRFTLDSVVGLTKQADTLFGSAVGTLTVREVSRPTTAEVKAFPEAGGMRVLAKWHISAAALQIDLVPKLHSIGLGANTLIWHDFFMGADLVLRPQATAAK
jgi:polyisoprenoid-binding protein YceI